MATNLHELIAQKENLEREIQRLQTTARAEALHQIQELMAQTGITVSDLAAANRPKAGGAKTSSLAGSTVAPKYRDAATGATWSGRGLKPKWLSAAIAAGKKLEDFAV